MNKPKYFKYDYLLPILKGLIKCNDVDLFERHIHCEPKQLKYYRALRDIFLVIFNHSEYLKSEAFQNETTGKTKAVIEFKSKYYKDPGRCESHKQMVLKILGIPDEMIQSKDIFNREHQNLLKRVHEIIEIINK